MTGRHIALMLLTSLLVSGVGLGGWSTPIPGLAQDSREDADVVVYQEPPEDVADVSVFYEPLAPYGTWTSLPEYGQVWIPRDVAPGWRPYTTGRWVYTAYGWTWVSDQKWGWAPFHYGRWAYVASYGWVWIPGTVWAPAWVVWRHTPGWVGWAPMPPQVVVRPGVEIRAANIDVHIAPSWFCFVEERRILAPRVITYITPPARNVSLIQITRNVTHYTVIQNRVVNRGIPVERIEKVVARPVPRLRIVEAQTPEAIHRARVREKEREVVLFRPAAPSRTTLPQQHDDTQHRLRERQIRERAALEERQRQAPPSQMQSLPPEYLRVQREAERRALEEKARRDRQEREPQQTQQQLQQRQGQERQRALQQQQEQQEQERQRTVIQQRQGQERQRALQQQQEQERQRALQQQAQERQRALQQQQHQEKERQRAALQQHQEQERQRAVFQQRQEQARQHALQQQSQQQLQQQAQERQRAVFQQQQRNHQPPTPQGLPPQVSQQPRGATQQVPQEGSKEQRKKQQ
jgi:DNA segregation ATPase FtsK/SpoIIIE-like protein